MTAKKDLKFFEFAKAVKADDRRERFYRWFLRILSLGLLTRALRRRGTALRLPLGYARGRVAAALLSVLPAWGLWWVLRDARVEITGLAVLLGYAGLYLALAHASGVAELEPVTRLLSRRSGNGRSGEGDNP